MTAAFVQTIKERCRMCYTCVRECPAKAIRIVDGQAEIIAERCIACGNCVRVCSQKAKEVRNTTDEVEALLASSRPVAACIAPSFPAQFPDIEYPRLVGMLRELGFAVVQEVSFGADLVARRYRDLLSESNGRRYISTSCPAIVGYIERYHPDLVECLAPIASPMVATARVLRHVHGDEMRVVFLGPCAAKKVEADRDELDGEIDAVLTFPELIKLFEQRGISSEKTTPSDFDLPHGGAGSLFPISRGSLQAADIQEDLMTGEVVSTQGRTHMVEAIREFATGDLGSRLLEVLCCEGCIMGAGIESPLPLFNRRRRVREYACNRIEVLDEKRFEAAIEQFADLDLRQDYTVRDQRIPAPADNELREIMARMGKFTPEDELNCGACGYDTCREHAVAIYKNLAESEMCLPHTIEELRKALQSLEASHRELADTQEALVQSEKLASMGQLAAGVAHEVNNPLGVVLMYAHLLLEESETDGEVREDLKMIVEQADRCKKIVGGLLDFARQNKVERRRADLRELVAMAVQAGMVPDSITVDVQHDLEDPIIEVDPDQIVQVLTNLVTNAVAAMDNQGRLTIRSSGSENQVRLEVSDTGVGIPKANLKKVFEPFFTTKRMGEGTGLGLAVIYGILKMHCGSISVKSNANPEEGPTGTTFSVVLPRRG